MAKTGPTRSDERLHVIAARLREAFSPSPDVPRDFADMLFAFDRPEILAIYKEIDALREEQIARLERILSRHADNDA